MENISAIISKWNGRRISSNQPILVSKLVPFISSSSNQKFATNIPSITINGQGFISFINNNTQIQVQLYQQQQNSSSSSSPTCSSIYYINSSQIVCENPQNLISNGGRQQQGGLGEGLFATILIDSE